MTDLAVIETHPIQYHAPVYRELQSKYGISVSAIYASDFSVAGYIDTEFGVSFAWDTDLLSGYEHQFLTRVAHGGARNAKDTTVHGLADALEEVNPRAVLLTGYSPRFYRNAFRTAQKQGVRMLFRAETTDHARRRGLLKRMIRDNALRYVYGKCDALLYVGERSLEHYLRLGVPPDDLIFSPYCVDTSVFQTSDADRERLRNLKRLELEIDPDDFVILYSGKLVPRKDPLRIVEAARQLNGAARPVIVFVGAGKLQQQIEIAASIDPPVQIRFPGFQNQRAMSAYYQAADCLVLPSLRDETWGLVVNEALAHGVPAVVSNAVGCAPDLIEDGMTGAVFDAGDADSLAIALRRVLPLLNNPATRARCREIVDVYSISNAARGIAAALERTD